MSKTCRWLIVVGGAVGAAALTWGSGERWTESEEAASAHRAAGPEIALEAAMGIAAPGATTDRAARAGGPPGRPTDEQLAEVLAALGGHDLTAARALLSRLGDSRLAVEALLGLVLRGGDLVTQLMAIQLLASIPGDSATTALVRIANEPSVALRARGQAVIGLGAQAGASATPALERLLDADEQYVRLAALRTLGLLGDPEALGSLAEIAWNESDPGVRRGAFESLAQLGTPEAVEHLTDLFHQETAAPGGDGKGVLAGIGMISSAEALPALLDAWARTDDPALQAALLRALGSIADPGSFDVLVDFLQYGGPGPPRLEAINALGNIGDPRALPALWDLAAAGDESERRFSRTAIDRILQGGA